MPLGVFCGGSATGMLGLPYAKTELAFHAFTPYRLSSSVRDGAWLTGFETTQYREDDKVIPVTLRSVAADRNDLGKLESFNIFSQSTGESVPLKQVADVEVVWQTAVIYRRNRLPTVTIRADVDPGVSPVEASFVIDD